MKPLESEQVRKREPVTAISTAHFLARPQSEARLVTSAATRHCPPPVRHGESALSSWATI